MACILLAVAVKGCPPVDNTCWYQQGYLDQGWESAAVEAVAAKFPPLKQQVRLGCHSSSSDRSDSSMLAWLMGYLERMQQLECAVACHWLFLASKGCAKSPWQG